MEYHLRYIDTVKIPGLDSVTIVHQLLGPTSEDLTNSLMTVIQF